jgi:hypothetical protein
MAERAAHLVDHVFPDVPVRQWVLSLPYHLRYRLAWDRDLCRVVVAVFRVLCKGARAAGLEQGRGGAVAVIQRFGGALNLNVHIHALVLDGVFARDGARVVGFHPARRLTTLDVAEVLATMEPRIRRLLDRRGLGQGEAEGSGVDVWADETPVLAGLAASPASIVSVTRARRSRRRHWVPVTRGGTASICLRASLYRRGSENGSSASADTRCGRPLRPSGSA